MITENKIKRRNFFGYMSGLIGGIFISQPESLIAKSNNIFKSEKKIVVRKNPLAVPRKKTK